MPLTKESHSGMSSSQLSMMNTRRTYSLMLLLFFLRVQAAREGHQKACHHAESNQCHNAERNNTQKVQATLYIVSFTCPIPSPG